MSYYDVLAGVFVEIIDRKAVIVTCLLMLVMVGLVAWNIHTYSEQNSSKDFGKGEGFYSDDEFTPIGGAALSEEKGRASKKEAGVAENDDIERPLPAIIVDHWTGDVIPHEGTAPDLEETAAPSEMINQGVEEHYNKE